MNQSREPKLAPETAAQSVEKSRIVSGKVLNEDSSFDLSLRPKLLDDFIGQKTLKENLAIAVEATKTRGEALDHILFYGPPGLGKTTLASIVANELGVGFRATAGPVVQIKGDLTAILTNVDHHDVLFFDEVHRLQPQLEEILYPALEDFRLDLIIGQGPSARSHTLTLHPFTFIGATTRIGLLSGPLRSRFGIVLRLDFYTQTDLEQIVKRSANLLNISLEAGGAQELATRSRGTPRIANRLLRRVRDYAQVKSDGRITATVARESLNMLAVDTHGLDEIDRQLLMTIIGKYEGGPVGLSTIAASLSEEADAIEEIYEPYLMQIGFLSRTPRGRVATPLAYKHLGKKPSGTSQKSLF